MRTKFKVKNYTLEQILSKLIEKKYIEDQTQIIIEIEDDKIKTTSATLHSNDDILLLAPVYETYIVYGDSLDKKRLLSITTSGPEYLITTACIKRTVTEMFGEDFEDIYSGYTVTIVCRRIPANFLKCFLYQEKLFSPDIFMNLVHFKNTIMNSTTYSNCIYWIKKHTEYIIEQYKQYNFKPKFADDNLVDSHRLLEDVLSIVAGFRVRIRLGNEAADSIYYVIEKV